MCDFDKYPKDFLTDFIHLFESFPCLWKVKSAIYKNRDQKTQSLDVLVNKWKEVNPDADRDFVNKKINYMKTVNRREMKKMSSKSGMGAEDAENQTSNIWFIDLLHFLKEHETQIHSSSFCGNCDKIKKKTNVFLICA